jgi:hypothetical protein
MQCFDELRVLLERHFSADERALIALPERATLLAKVKKRLCRASMRFMVIWCSWMLVLLLPHQRL